MTTDNTAADILDISMDSFADADIATLNVVIAGKPSGWLWEFAGPGHPKAIEQSNRLSRERLHKEKLIEQATVNRKKWIADQETPEEVRANNVKYVVERIVGWSPIRIDSKDFPFSPENARLLLSDPKRIGLLAQALEFIAADNSFTQRSATN